MNLAVRTHPSINTLWQRQGFPAFLSMCTCVYPQDTNSLCELTQKATLKMIRPHFRRPSCTLLHSNSPCLVIVLFLGSISKVCSNYTSKWPTSTSLGKVDSESAHKQLELSVRVHSSRTSSPARSFRLFFQSLT